MSQNYYEDAIPLLESGLAIAPQRADLLAALGESYFMAGKMDKAIEKFRKLVATRSISTVLCFPRHLLPASRPIRRSKAIFSGRPQARSSQQRMPIQSRLDRRAAGRLRTSRNDVQQALHSNPDFAPALLELANLRIVARSIQKPLTCSGNT